LNLWQSKHLDYILVSLGKEYPVGVLNLKVMHFNNFIAPSCRKAKPLHNGVKGPWGFGVAEEIIS
jgi:hypothetical protein